MFRSMWVQAANLGEPEVLVETLRSAELDPAELLDFVEALLANEA